MFTYVANFMNSEIEIDFEINIDNLNADVCLIGGREHIYDVFQGDDNELIINTNVDIYHLDLAEYKL